MKTLLAGAFWSGRLEAYDAAAKRTSSMFNGLSEISDTLSQWRETSSSLAATSKECLDGNLAAITKVFQTEFSRPRPSSNTLSFWNGRDDSFVASIMLSVGRQETKYVKNFVTVTFNGGGLDSNLDDICRLLVRVWEPEWAHISDKQTFVKSEGKIVLGKVLYVKHSIVSGPIERPFIETEEDGGIYYRCSKVDVSGSYLPDTAN